MNCSDLEVKGGGESYVTLGLPQNTPLQHCSSSGLSRYTKEQTRIVWWNNNIPNAYVRLEIEIDLPEELPQSAFTKPKRYTGQ